MGAQAILDQVSVEVESMMKYLLAPLLLLLGLSFDRILPEVAMDGGKKATKAKPKFVMRKKKYCRAAYPDAAACHAMPKLVWECLKQCRTSIPDFGSESGF